MIFDDVSTDRVKQVNTILIDMGVKTWTIDIQTSGTGGRIVAQIFDRIDRSKCATVFMSESLSRLIAAQDIHPVQTALEYAVRTLGPARVIPVALEMDYMDVTNWPMTLEGK